MCRSAIEAHLIENGKAARLKPWSNGSKSLIGASDVVCMSAARNLGDSRLVLNSAK